MDEQQDQSQQPQVEQPEVQEEDFELNHSDKLVDVFSEPATTFEKISKGEPKTVDWLIPILLVAIVGIIANFVMMSNPTIKYSIVEKQMAQMEERLNEMVESGQMSESQKDQQLNQTRDFMENQMGAQMIFSAIGILIFTFIMFFIVSGVFFAVAKFGLKDDSTYKHAMVAYGLPQYILVIQIIVMVILAFIFDRFFEGTSVAALMDSDKNTFAGWVLAKLDIFSIWFYAVVAVGFAKVFKSENTGKYFGMVFGLWIGFSLIMFFLKEAVPFLRWFGV